MLGKNLLEGQGRLKESEAEMLSKSGVESQAKTNRRYCSFHQAVALLFGTLSTLSTQTLHQQFGQALKFLGAAGYLHGILFTGSLRFLGPCFDPFVRNACFRLWLVCW